MGELGKVYVVMGSTGEYSDRSEWVVCGYFDQSMAEAHVLAADEKAREIQAARPDRYSVEKGSNPFDPDMSMDYYTGTSYYMVECDMRSQLPEQL